MQRLALLFLLLLTPAIGLAAHPASHPARYRQQESRAHAATTIALEEIAALLLLTGTAPLAARGARRALVRRTRRRRYRQALDVATSELTAQRRTLQIRKLQLVAVDAYGTADPARWHRERAYFCRTRLLPRLAAAGLADQWPLIGREIQRRLELAASAPFVADVAQSGPASDPRVFDPLMQPGDYERHCAMLLRMSGWDTRVTGASGDQGTDVLARRGSRTLVVQCKLYRRPVGNGAVQEVAAARLHQRADLAAVVSNAPFTAAARQLARSTGVHLLHHEQLRDFAPA